MPVDFAQVGKLMRFNRLDAAPDMKLLTLAFRITDSPMEKWTARFNRVKVREAAAMDAAIQTMIAAFDGGKYGQARVVAVGAISSGDTSLDPGCPAAVLGAPLAAARGWEWAPELIAKDAHRGLHGLGSGSARDAEVEGRYRSGKLHGASGRVVVIDDFCTRGATMGDVRRAILGKNPGWIVSGISPGKTERLSWVPDLNNDHVPAELDAAWTEAGA